MILGTDGCLKECWKMGYTMIQFRKGSRFKRDKEYKIISPYAKWFRDRMKWDKNKGIRVYHYTFNELEKSYRDRIEKYGSIEEIEKDVDFKDPSFIDFLFLADSLIFYYGLD